MAAPVFANEYFDGTYDPTEGTVYRTENILSNLIDDYTGEEIQFIKIQDPSAITPDGIIYRQLVTPEFGTEVFKRIYEGGISVLWFGAVGDNIADDTAAIQLAANTVFDIRSVSTLGANMTLLFPSGYLFNTTDTLFIPGNINVDMQVRVNYRGPKDRPAIVVGNAGTASMNVTLNLSVASIPRQNLNWTNPEHIGIKLINQNANIITISTCDAFYKGIVCMGDATGFVYNSIFLKQLYSNKYGVYLDFQNDGWCNENKFYGGRFSTESNFNSGQTRIGARITGDDNIFYSPSFELNWLISRPGFSQAAILDDAYDCRIFHCRNEGNSSKDLSTPAASFILNGNSKGNIIEVAYSLDRQRGKESNAFEDNSATKQNVYRSTQNMFAEAQFGRVIFDSGNLAEKASRYAGANQIMIPDVLFASYNSSTVSTMSPADVTAEILDKNSGAYVELLRTGFAIKLNTAFSKKFAIIRNGVEGRGGRIGIKCYDENGVNITSESDWKIDSQAGFDSNNQLFAWSTNYGGCYLTGTPSPASTPVYFSLKEEVKSLYIIIGNPAGYTSLKSFKILALDNEAKNSTAYYSPTYNDRLNRVDGIPTVGTHTTGKLFFERLPSSGQPLIHVCSRFGTAHSLTDNGNVTSGNTSITNLTNVAQFNVGDFLTIQNATGPQYIINRVDIAANTIILNTSTGLVTGIGLSINNQPPEFRSVGLMGINFSGNSSPEGVITAPVGSTYQQLGGINGSSLWIKLSGTDNTGWTETQIARSGFTSQRPSNPSVGFMYFNLSASDSGPEWWNGTAWVRAQVAATPTRFGVVRQAASLNASTATTQDIINALKAAGIMAA